VLADEINRTPPKTQSALLEAMQEHRVTVQGKTYVLEEPFFVFATQNPIELEGTYPLPEAQLDRFMFEIIIDYLSAEEELEVVRQTTSLREIAFEYAMSGAEIRAFQQLVRKVPVSKPVSQYALDLVRHSRPGSDDALDFVNDWVDYGASTRAAQYLMLQLAKPVLRHRVLRNFHAESEKITSDELIERLLDAVPLPSSGM
jgi:MoxR-like ATPase